MGEVSEATKNDTASGKMPQATAPTTVLATLERLVHLFKSSKTTERENTFEDATTKLCAPAGT